MSKLNKISPIDSTNVGRTSHDMSHGLKFTVAAGHINPVEHDILLAGDTVYHGFDFIARNHVPFVSPAALSLDFHVDYFFVPMELLYKPFSSFVYGINDEWSSLFDDISSIGFPLMDMRWLYYKAFQLRKMETRTWPALYPESQSGKLPNECYGKMFLRLWGLLGFPDYFATDQFNLSSQEIIQDPEYLGKELPSVFPYAFLAYKCIYQYYFRDDERETFNNSYFNWDSYYMQSIVNPSLEMQDWEKYCIDYRNAYKDYFTACRRSPLINERNLMHGTTDLRKVYADLGLSDVALTGFNYSDDSNPDSTFSGAPLSVTQLNAVTDANVFEQANFARTTDQYRKLFAVEKLLMVTQAARKNYDAQTLAHLGFKVPHDARHQISHIGHELVTMDVREITAMAGSDGSSDTGNVQFGDYAGKGTCALNAKGIKFTAPCHGVLLTTLSVVPRYDYFTDFLKKNFIQTRLSFFQPEFDHLGMQPLYAFESEVPVSIPTATLARFQMPYRFIPSEAKDIILGWQYRYEEKKRQFNRTTSAFFFDSDLQSWTISRLPFDRLYAGISYNPRAVSPENAWSIDPSSYYTDPVYPVKVHPWDTDNLFLAKYELEWPVEHLAGPQGSSIDYELFLANPAKMYDSDPFVVFGRSRYKKVSIMSTYSMPKLD